LLVGRDRFLPVKTTNDLLVMRSDSYDLSEDGRLSPAPNRATSADPFVDLDADYYRILHDFDARFPFGPPSLVECVSLTVRGDVTFGADVTVRGQVELSVSADGPQVANGAVLGSPATS
jgi:UTP--glucose-1-phosphate uridylyltransferase